MNLLIVVTVNSSLEARNSLTEPNYKVLSEDTRLSQRYDISFGNVVSADPSNDGIFILREPNVH